MSRLWVLGLAALPLVACKPKASSQAPGRNVQDWTLAEIEAELAHNDQALAGEGIMVAVATPAVGAEPRIEPASPEPAPITESESLPFEEGSEDRDIQPSASPPTAMPEAALSHEAELTTADGASDRRTSQRRMSSRARRDELSRCERVCQLAEATCELEDQICALAERHPDEPRYEQACLRAEQQCVAASQACQRCEE